MEKQRRCRIDGAGIMSFQIFVTRNGMDFENMKKTMRNVVAPLWVMMAVLLSAPAWAATVTNTNDSGAGSLRQAIADAAAGDTITFGIAIPSTITLTGGELVIDKDLTISGPGSGKLTIQRSTAGGTPKFRIFNITSGLITISGVTVSNGVADGDTDSLRSGGGINNEGTLTLDGCVITGNSAKESGGGVANRLNGGRLTLNKCFVTGNSVTTVDYNGFGGGVYNGSGTMDVTDCTVNNNSVQAGAGRDAYGGGVYNDGVLTIIGSKINGNHSTGGGDADGGGGGIFNDNLLTMTTSTVDSNTATGGAGSGPGRGYGGGIANGGGEPTLDRNTVSGNFAVGGAGSGSSGGSGDGGGIAVDFGAMTVFTSTVSGNTSRGGAGDGAGGPGSPHGGGIFNQNQAITFLFNSTIAANIVDVVPAGFTQDGGGIYNIGREGGGLGLGSTIVAGNTGTFDFFNDPSGIIATGGFNLIGTTNVALDVRFLPTGPFDPASDWFKSATEVNLGPLQDNGGPTFTHALLCDSFAIDKGNNSSVPDPSIDQRGFPRPESVGGLVDIGAYEARSNTAPTISCPAPIIVDCASQSCEAKLSAIVGDAESDPLAVGWRVDGTTAGTSLVPEGGTSASFTHSFAVGTYTISVSVSDPSGCSATCSTTVEVKSIAATDTQINIVKLTNNTNNDSAPGIKVLTGSTVTWTYTVTNPGNEPLKNVTVSDSVPGVIPAFQGVDANGLLDPGETWTYTATGTAVIGQYSNIGTANGTGNVSDKPATHSNPDFYFGLNPAINIVVLTNGTDNDAPTGPHLVEGSDVEWTYAVTNPGSEPQKNVTVSDSVVGPITGFTGGDANNNGLLDPGETWTYTKGAVVLTGQYENIGTANGTGNVSNQPVTNSNPDHYFGDPWATPCPDGVFSYGNNGSVIDPVTGDLNISYDQFPAPNDNSYGVNAIGWLNGHSFKDLVQSDHAGFQLRNPNGTTMLSFDIDYLTATPVTAETPSGHKSLGPFGGDGAVLGGTLTPADLTWDTSLARNLNNLGYCRVVNSAADCTTGGVNLLVDSPPTNATHTNYVNSNPSLLRWNFHNTYFVTIKKAKLQSIGFLDANGNPVPGWTVEPNATTLHNSPAKVCPGTPLIPATGGAAISADTAATGAFTALTGPIYTEGLPGQVGTGTFILNAPDGFVFDTGGTRPTVSSIKAGAGSGSVIQGSVTAVTPAQITYTVTASSSTRSRLTWQNVRVRPIAGTPLVDGNLTRGGTATVAISIYANFGTLHEVAGAASKLLILTQPSATATAGAPFAQQPVVAVADQFGNVRSEANCDGPCGTAPVVTAARLAGSGTLQGTTSMAAADGTVTFTNLSHNVASNITIQFTSTGLTAATSNSIAVGAATASRLTFTTQPGNATAGSVFGSQPVVRAEDQFGNASAVGLAANLTLSLSLTGGTGPLQGTTSVDIGTGAGNGTATFTNLRIDVSGANKQLTASAPGLTSAVSAVFTVNPGPPVKLAIQTQPPTTATAGVTFSPAPAIRIMDAFGNLITTSSSTVTAARSLGTAALLGTTSVAAVNGVATFANLSYTKAETITIAFTSGTLTGATSANVTVNPGPPSKMTIQTQPSATATAGVAFAQQPVIRIEDAFGNLCSGTMVTVARNAGSGSLQGALTATAVNGIATFANLSHNVANTINLSFTVTGLTGAISSDIAVSPAAFAKLQLLAPGETAAPGTTKGKGGPAPAVTVGAPFNITVNAVDNFWNLVNPVTDTVGITSSDATATLPPNTALVSGTATMAVYFNIAGTFTLTASDLTDASISAGASSVITASLGQFTPATGGEAIPADGATGTFTTLTGPTFTETKAGQVGKGTIILNAPAGFIFDTGGIAPTVSSVRVSGSGTTVQGSVTAVTPAQITYTVTAISSAPSRLTWQNVRVRPTLGTPLTSGYLTCGGTASVAGLPANSHLGSLREVAGAASGLVILTQPSATATAGVPFAQQPVLEVRDQFGNLRSAANGVSGTTVTAARLAGSGTLQGTTSMATASDGTVTFTNLSHNVASTITIQFSSGSATATSSPIAVSAASASRLAFTTQPGNATAGSVFGSQPVVRAEDQFGNASTTGLAANLNLSLGLTAGTGPLQGTASFDIGTGAGTATFTDLQIDAAGAGKQLTASAAGLTSALSTVFTVNPGPAVSLAIQTQPTTVTAGITFSPAPAIRILDAFGNVVTTSNSTVMAVRNLGTAALQGTSSVAAVNGVATFANLSYTKAETITLDFTSGSLTGATSNSVTVNPAPASKLTIQTQPSAAATAGVAFAQQPVIRIEDAFGNLCSGAVVTAARNAGSGTLQGTLTATAVNGVATFANLSHNVANTINLSFTVSGLTGATSSNIVVSPAAFAKLQLLAPGETTAPGTINGKSGPAPSVTVGAPFDITVNAVDNFWNIVNTVTDTVGITSSDATANLPPNTALVSGTATMTVYLNTAGAFTLTASDLTDVSKNAGITAITASLGQFTPATGGGAIPADSVATGAFTTLTGPAFTENKAGQVGQGTIILNAPAGFIFDTGGTAPTVSSVKLSGSGRNPILGSVTAVTTTQITYTVTATSGNPTQFTWQNVRVRPISGTPLASGYLTSGGTASVAGLPANAHLGTLREVAGAVGGLVILTQPSATATAGVPFAQQPVLEVRDQFGNLRSAANGVSSTSVTAARLAGSGTLQGTTSMTTAPDGTVTFTNLSHNMASTITIQFTGTGATPSTSDDIVVSAAAASRLAFTTQPGNANAGSAFGSQPVVRTEDQFGNASTVGLPANVNLNLSLTGTGPLQGTASFDIGTGTGAGNGTATFTDLQIDAAGAGKQLTASAAGLTSALSTVFTVNPGPAVSLAIQTQPTTVTAGVTFSPAPAVRIVDAFGNLATTSSAVVTAALNLGTATLQGTTSVTTVNGVATFANLSYTKAETITIDFTNGTLTGAASASVTVNPAAASKLTIQTQPSAAATAGVAFAQQPVLRIEDAFGNLRSGDNSTVVTAARGAGSGTLQGALTATAVNGVATFANLSHNVANTITLSFTASGVAGATSGSIVVGPAAAAQLVFATLPGGVSRTGSPLATQPVVKSVDKFGNPSAAGLPANFNVALALTGGSGSLVGTTGLDIGIAAGSGTAAFTGVQCSAAGQNKQITASAVGLTPAVSAPFFVGGLEPATGGEAIASSTAGGAYTALTGSVYYEIASADVGTGTIILNAPSGFVFDTGGTAPTVRIDRTAGAGAKKVNINALISGSSAAITSRSATQITFTVTTASSNGVTCSLTWQNIRVRPSAIDPLASGDIVKSGTSVMKAVTNSSTSFGQLTEVSN